MIARQKRTSRTIRGFAATRGARDVVKQAEADVRHGLKDTDRRGAPARPARKKRTGGR